MRCARATDDQAASTDSAAVSVTVTPLPAFDNTAPTSTLTAPANLADNILGTLTISADATDDLGVAGVEFQIDGVNVGSEDLTAAFAATIDATQWASGQHVVRARARDVAGNRSPWSTAVVRFGGSRSIGAGFTKDEAWVTGISSATAFAQAADGRLFVAEQGGSLRIVKDGVGLYGRPAPVTPGGWYGGCVSGFI